MSEDESAGDEDPGLAERALAKLQEEEAERQDLLSRLNNLKRKGTVVLSKNFTAKSSLVDLRLEWGRIQHEHTMERSKKKAATLLTGGLGAIEIAATRSTRMPLVVRSNINGFSKYVDERIDEYDEAFEAFAEQYGGRQFGRGQHAMVQFLMVFAQHIVLFALDRYSKVSAEQRLVEDEARMNAIVDAKFAEKERAASEARQMGPYYASQQQQQMQRPPPQQQAMDPAFMFPSFPAPPPRQHQPPPQQTLPPPPPKDIAYFVEPIVAAPPPPAPDSRDPSGNGATRIVKVTTTKGAKAKKVASLGS